MTDWLIDDIFHGCAGAGYTDEDRLAGRPPDSEAVRLRAYRSYEEELRRKDDQTPTLTATEDVL